MESSFSWYHHRNHWDDCDGRDPIHVVLLDVASLCKYDPVVTTQLLSFNAWIPQRMVIQYDIDWRPFLGARLICMRSCSFFWLRSSDGTVRVPPRINPRCLAFSWPGRPKCPLILTILSMSGICTHHPSSTRVT